MIANVKNAWTVVWPLHKTASASWGNSVTEASRCADVWCNHEVAQYLCKPLPSTKLPPHYVTCDKATPSRITNQAVMVCPMVDGHRQAIAVSSCKVYNDANSEIEGDVCGASAPELAHMLYDEIKKAYSSIRESIVHGAWMGTVCDGAYQAAEFASTLTSIFLLSCGILHFSLIWHSRMSFKERWEAQRSLDRSVQRSCVVRRIFQRGKILNHAMEMMNTDDDLVLKLTSRTCSTRFTTSQYAEFRKLLDSLPLYVRTFRQFQFYEVKEYMVAGDDFLLELCGICDVLALMMERMVELQGLSLPCWKGVTWWPKLKSRMQQLQKKPPLTTE